MITNDRGFDLSSPEATVAIYLTTISPNMRKLDHTLHMDGKVLSKSHALVRQSRWFEENAHHSSVKMMIRLIHDLKKRFQGFEPLTHWMIDLLAHYCVMNNPSREPLPIGKAYKCVSLLAEKNPELKYYLVEYRKHNFDRKRCQII